jgi:hypothetical protein
MKQGLIIFVLVLYICLDIPAIISAQSKFLNEVFNREMKVLIETVINIIVSHFIQYQPWIQYQSGSP